MFLFPVIYIAAFILSIKNLFQKKLNGIFLFFIFGLPIYITSLSVTYQLGFTKLVPILQSFKELLLIGLLAYLIVTFKRKIHFHLIDKLVLFFLGYSLLYVFLPLGQYGILDKLIAVKGLSFFVCIYFSGRLIDIKKIYVSQYFHLICAVTIAAAAVLFVEVINYQHLQTLTGYTDYHIHYFNQEPNGSYGLTWTFEIENGAKRFASFFSNPLEHSAATLLTTAILAALYTTDDNKIKIDGFGLVVLACTIFSISFALSRASFVNYFILIYLYAWITRKKLIIKIINYTLLTVTLIVFYFAQKDLSAFIINTITFENSSSVGHIIEWANGIEAMIKSPLGLGLGESGRVSSVLDLNVGGENQFIIIGAQVGIIALGVYLAIYILTITYTWKWFKKLKGKERKVCLALLLMKIGFFIPLMTSYFDSFNYLTYISWFINGLFISIIVEKEFENKIETCPSN